MRKIILYIAMSLDGYIATEKGGVDWLAGDGSDANDLGSYPQFIETIDTIILGYRTYHQIVSELAPGNWPYKGKTSYVFTHRMQRSSEEVLFTNLSVKEQLMELKSKRGKDIWICGGATIVQQCLKEDLIDVYRLSIMPIILGAGIPLFARADAPTFLKCIKVERNNGIVELVYEKKDFHKNAPAC